MKEIFRAIDNAYSALDDCISKIVKSRLHKDKESEERALYKLEIETNGVLQDLSYIKRQLQKKDWIKVEDRLPEEGVWVLISQQSVNVGIGIYCRGKWYDDMDSLIDVPPTHWMLIPEIKED